jgi:hypothetical protein
VSGQNSPAYCCAPEITWVKDGGQALLVAREQDRSWILRGAEAAIWDLLTLQVPFEGLVRFLAVLLHVPEEQAGATLMATIHRWEEAGILYRTRGSEGDEPGHQHGL